MPTDLLARVLDALPSSIFVTDAELHVVHTNAMARRLLVTPGDFDLGGVVLRSAGDLFRCIQAAKSPRGCGGTPACEHCVIRNAVGRCIEQEGPVRERLRFQQATGAGVKQTIFLLTAARFEHEGKSCAILSLDDLRQVLAMQSILPVCAWCHRVRIGADRWEQVESYLSESLAIDCTHGLCLDCDSKHFPELAARTG